LIDLHSHILPGVDDGASDLNIALDMARMAVDDGIQVMACTPHFMPGMYDNTAIDIRNRINQFQSILKNEGIPLQLVVGCDGHIRPDFLAKLRSDEILRLNDSRYVLFEPPHNIAPQRLDDLMFNILVAGYVPILTHPERLKWIEQGFDVVEKLFQQGVWMQITAGSLTGKFGSRPQYWSQKMLAEGMIHILATDAHNLKSRPPILSAAYQLAVAEVGLDEAQNLVLGRPVMILDDQPAANAPPIAVLAKAKAPQRSRLGRLFFGELQ
jgi:protein-tyrosine phosphatase